MSNPRLAAPILDIFNVNVITDAEESLVLTDNAVCRRVLRKFKWGVVRPAFWHLESTAFNRDTREELPGLNTSYDYLA